MLQTNDQIELAGEFLRSTGVNIFLTGKAGTGKTTFLQNVVSSLNKRYVVVAPTGVAAINARGVTLHSLFQLPFGPNLPNSGMSSTHSGSTKDLAYRKMGRNKLAILRSLELLVIDEISMVRSDLLDAVDETLKRVRRNSLPFGGVQLLMVGDLQQLSPICRDDEWNLLKNHYATPYFFDSLALRASNYITIELQQIFRQSDNHFTSLLNAVRENRLTNEVLNSLNERYIADFNPTPSEGYITLTTHNYSANYINNKKLGELPSESIYYEAEIEKEYPESSYPNDATLELKVGAQVIFLKNDASPEKLYYNGMVGEVVALGDNSVTVRPKSGDEEIEVGAVAWENIEYTINKESGEIEESVKGSFSQIPLKCAWAITIHKSQGLTFDRAIIDATSSFAHGQVYVALSRCRTLEGMVLSKPLTISSFVSDSNIEQFNSYVEQCRPTSDELHHHQKEYFRSLLCEIFNFSNITRMLSTLSRLFDSSMYKDFPQLCDKIKISSIDADNDLYKVGETFQRHISQAIVNCTEDYSNDSFIKERLTKASGYYTPKIESLISFIGDLYHVKPDAKDVAKRVVKLYDDLSEELALKKCGVELCGDHFTVEEYLKRKFEVVTKSVVKAPKPKKDKTPKNSKGESLKAISDIIHSDLYTLLTDWRADIADETSKPLYTILTNRSLIEIQATLPSSVDQLKEISGIGKDKIERYGEDIIDFVKEYAIDNSINLREYHDQKIGYTIDTVADKKKEKIASHIITLDLYRSGESLDNIAHERILSRGTINSHIARNIKEGELKLEDFVDKEKIEIIENAIAMSSDGTIKSVKDIVDGKATYDEVLMVINSKN